MFGIGEAMLLASVLATGASVGGGLMANSEREEQANSANKWGVWMQQGQQAFAREMAARNEANAATARDWMERMSNTSYQRGMADMRKAGINPILAYQQGGATSPATSAATAPMAGGSGPGAMAQVTDAISPAVSSGMQAMRMVQNIQSAQEQIDQTRANTNLQQVQAGREAAATGNILQQTASEAERTGLIGRQAATEAARLGLVQAQAGAASAQAGLASAQTTTEGARWETERNRGSLVGAQASNAWQESERMQNYGPRSTVTDAAASAEAISRRIQRTMQEGLGPLLRVYD